MRWQRGPDLKEIAFSGKSFPLTSLELVKEGLLDLAGLLPLGVLPSRLLAHLTVQHGLSRITFQYPDSRLQNYGHVSLNNFFSADLEWMMVVFRK